MNPTVLSGRKKWVKVVFARRSPLSLMLSGMLRRSHHGAPDYVGKDTEVTQGKRSRQSGTIYLQTAGKALIEFSNGQQN